ncbi:hypothetical protein V6N12_069831 [Hibiscus sabdariffa]|uniref:BED-type domain-containing protein n=1 Tax=Hibiscus sabdariffa TaxID=183260 RepID=A0ABR2FEY9_9ROSI
MSSEPQSSSTPVGVSRVEELFVNVDDNFNEEDECNVEASEPLLDTTTKEAEVENPFRVFKKPRRSKVWDDFLEPEFINKQWKVRCKYCNQPLSVLKSKSTSHLKRHIDGCIKKSRFLKQQQALNFLPSESSTGTDQSGFVSALHDGKVDMLKMREAMAHWITMHEHPFSIVEEEGFNLMMKRGMPQWTSVSRVTIRSDSFKVYEFEKLKLKLQKRVLNFVHLPPPRKWANIAYCILKCLKEWEIEDKVFTISVDNASANDSCIKILKDNFATNGRLLCNEKLFRVRCCAHILNIMVQHGLQQVQDIIEKVHDTVDFLNASDARLKRFDELASQYNVQDRKLILECKTRWNSTYDMLDCAIKFRKVFPRYALHDHSYNYCPDDDEWEKIEKLLEILKVFKATTNIISGSEYPTANLFLGEVQRIKVLLDVKSESLDDFVKSMVANMKERFTKYWGECNLLMAIGLVMDPRLKMRAVEIAFPKMFPSNLVRENIGKVKDIMYQLFEEYLRIYSSTCNVEESGECAFPINAHGGDVTSSGLSELLQDVFSGETSIPRVKNELDLCLDEGCIFSQDVKFDAIAWWREKSNKFRILSKMASPDGDIIDCVLLHHQPAFDHPQLKGQQPSFVWFMRYLQDPPERPRAYEAEGMMNMGAEEEHVQLWRISGETCPEGTIPIRRTREEDMLRASSVRRFGRKPRRAVRRDSSSNGHEHAVGYVNGEEYYGAKGSINVWAPRVTDQYEFSLSQLWLISGSFAHDLNTIEAGFVQTNNRIAIGTAISPISSYHGGQFDITLLVWKDPKHGHWWLEFGPGVLVGYWPSFLFTHLRDHATMVQFGGEVVNSRTGGFHTSTAMGSGHFSGEGFGKASYFRNLQVVDWDNNIIPLSNLRLLADHPDCYDIRGGINGDWGYYFYYGGPGRNIRCP